MGDKEHGKPLFSIDCKGIFEKEIDQQVVRGEIDFAVHSLKDVPIVERQEGTVLAAIPKRDSQHDVFISKNKISLNDLPARLSWLEQAACEEWQKSNIYAPTWMLNQSEATWTPRLNKVRKGEFAGIVIAEAGLERMNLENEITERLSLDQFPSAAGQGAIAIVAKEGNESVIALLRAVEDKCNPRRDYC